MKKHVGVLTAGLVTTIKIGRVRTCRITVSCRLEEEIEWIARYRQVWDARFDAVGQGDRRIETKGEAGWPQKQSGPTHREEPHERAAEVRARGRRNANLRLPSASSSSRRGPPPNLFRQWWVPKSLGMKLRSCELDVRVGGSYHLVFGDDPSNTMAFFGKYLEVTPNSRLV